MEITKEQYEDMLAKGASSGISKERVDASLARKGYTVKTQGYFSRVGEEAVKGVLDIPKSVVKGARAGAAEYDKAGQAFREGDVMEGVGRTISGVAGSALKSAGGALTGMFRTALSPVTPAISSGAEALGVPQVIEQIRGTDTVQKLEQGYGEAKKEFPGLAASAEGAAELITGRLAPKGFTSMSSRAEPYMKGSAERMSAVAGKKEAEAVVAQERALDESAIKYFQAPTEKGLRGSKKNLEEISRRGGEKQSRIQSAMNVTERDPLVLKENKDIARVVREYGVSGQTRVEAQRNLGEVIKKVDDERIDTARNSIAPRSWAGPDLGIPKLITPDFKKKIKNEAVGTDVNIDNVVKSYGKIIASEMRKEMRENPTDGFGVWMDKAITSFKAKIKETDPKAFDPDAPDGPIKRRIAEEYRKSGRALVQDNMINKEFGMKYKKLADDERVLIQSLDNAVQRGTLESGSFAEGVVSGSKSPMVLAGTAAGAGAIAASLLGSGVGSAVLSGLTGAMLATLLAGGAARIGGNLYTKSGVRRLIWKEVGSLTKQFSETTGEAQKSIAMEIAASVAIMNILSQNVDDESVPKDEDIEEEETTK